MTGIYVLRYNPWLILQNRQHTGSVENMKKKEGKNKIKLNK